MKKSKKIFLIIRKNWKITCLYSQIYRILLIFCSNSNYRRILKVIKFLSSWRFIFNYWKWIINFNRNLCKKNCLLKLKICYVALKLKIKMNSSDLALIFTKILNYYIIIKKKKQLKSEIFRFFRRIFYSFMLIQ